MRCICRGQHIEDNAPCGTGLCSTKTSIWPIATQTVQTSRPRRKVLGPSFGRESRHQAEIVSRRAIHSNSNKQGSHSKEATVKEACIYATIEKATGLPIRLRPANETFAKSLAQDAVIIVGITPTAPCRRSMHTKREFLGTIHGIACLNCTWYSVLPAGMAERE